MRELTIAGRRIADDTDAFCIAEVGHNHGGSVERCKQMIRAAAVAGADAVKLQKRNNKSLYTEAYYNRPYNSENSYGSTYGAHREALEFGSIEYNVLKNDAEQQGVAFFATAFDKSSAVFLNALGVPAFKIASNDILNLPLLTFVAEAGKPMIVSTGAATEADIDRAVNAIWPLNQQLALLQCTAMYPAPPERLDLRVITTLRERYPDITIGLSSHYDGISDVVAAYVLGARIFEKHFTLSRSSKGTDHAYSLQPAGFAKMVSYLKKTRLMLGSDQKVIYDEEQPAIEKMRKSTRWWAEQYGAVPVA